MESCYVVTQEVKGPCPKYVRQKQAIFNSGSFGYYQQTFSFSGSIKKSLNNLTPHPLSAKSIEYTAPTNRIGSIVSGVNLIESHFTNTGSRLAGKLPTMYCSWNLARRFNSLRRCHLVGNKICYNHCSEVSTTCKKT